MVDLHSDKAGLQRAAQELGATDAQVLQAVRSTISNMARWARSRSVRELAGGLVVPQEILRPRIKAQRLRRTATGAEADVWYGLNPVALIRLGAGRTRAGVSAKGGRHIEGAFIVFPAYAGMNRAETRHGARWSSVPRVCGDEPTYLADVTEGVKRSPRMRG